MTRAGAKAGAFLRSERAGLASRRRRVRWPAWGLLLGLVASAPLAEQSLGHGGASARPLEVAAYRTTARRQGLTPLFQSFSAPSRARTDVPRLRVKVAPVMQPAPLPHRPVSTPAAAGGSPGKGKYRTMCVRTCDGYYFPISFRTTRAGFSDDEKACDAACDAPVRLFYYANPGEEPEAMRDLDGKPYRELENAFRYRKQFVADCRCRPEPWTEEARRRHALYGEAEALTGEPAGAGEAEAAAALQPSLADGLGELAAMPDHDLQ
jgi:hypothetical protein